MIFDKISNIKNYKEIPTEVADFILSLTPETYPGHYEISTDIYANIDCYTTKAEGEGKLESHKKYIDIQLLLDGVERLDFTDTADLTVSETYNPDKDIMFYAKPGEFLNSVKLEYGNFIMLYPHEAHQPQMSIKTPQNVKKVVVKIPVTIYSA